MKTFLLSALGGMVGFLARLTVLRYKPGIVGVTGNVGKTSTKEAIRAVLESDRRVRAARKNFNNELGLPLTILGDWKDSEGKFFWLRVICFGVYQLIVKNQRYPEVLVLEYGVDRPGDMKRLLNIARPHVGVFTALGEIPVHVEFFAGREGIFAEKSRLIAQLPATGFAVLNADDELVLSAKEQARARAITFGFSEKADVRINNMSFRCDETPWETNFKLTYGGSTVPVRLQGVLGGSHAYAASAAASVGLIFGINLVKVAEALRHFVGPPGRMRALPGIKGTVIIDDTYNASPAAMVEALATLKEIPTKRKIAVLGDMLELGRYTLEAHEKIGRLAAKSAKVLVTVGLRGKFIAEAAVRAGLSRQSIFTFMDVREAGIFLQDKMQKDDVILVKASQGVRLEKIVKEVMAEPQRAGEFLVRQSRRWEKTPGLYDAPQVA